MSDNHNLHGDATLSHLTTRALQAELSRRDEGGVRPECGSGGIKPGSYNLSLHVFALFLILALSTIACSFPIIARRFPKLPIPHRFLFLSRHFGTGVLIATAFVHLLPTAFVSLTDPCLSPFWTEGYPASAGLVAMLSVFMVVGIEMFFATRGAGHIHSAEYGALNQDQGLEEEGHTHGQAQKRRGSNTVAVLYRPKHLRQQSLKFFDSPENRSYENVEAARANGHFSASPAAGKPYDLENDANVFKIDDSPPSSPPAMQLQTRRTRRDSTTENEDTDSEETLPHHDPLTSTTPQPYASGTQTPPDDTTTDRETKPQASHEEQKALLQCLLLEAGILFHSIFIGMALSVATGTPFIVLLVAISFHQTFEGLALGSRIAAITSFGPSSPKPWFMALAYGTTTPVGQAIGLVVHNLYDPASETGLLMVGVMNAISSGLLLFAGLVELLAEDFLSDKSYETLQGRKRVHACVAVVAGSLLMALVGAWA